MTIHTAGRSGHWLHFEVGNRMIDNLKIGLEAGIRDLLEKQV